MKLPFGLFQRTPEPALTAPMPSRPLPPQQHSMPEFTEAEAFAALTERLQAPSAFYRKFGMGDLRIPREAEPTRPRVNSIRFFVRDEANEMKLRLWYYYPPGDPALARVQHGGFELYLINADWEEINVERLFRVHERVEDARLFLQPAGLYDFSLYFDEFFAMLNRAFTGEFASLIRGESWEEITPDKYDDEWLFRWDTALEED